MKRFVVCVVAALSVLLMAFVITVISSENVMAAGDVTIEDTSVFPDPGFRDYLSKYVDADKDGVLSTKEIQNTQSISISGATYSDSLKGVELFTNLKSLEFNDCNIKNLDISKNTLLEKLSCNNNMKLEVLDLRNNKCLVELYCSNCGLSSLDLSKNAALKVLKCGNNNLENLNLSKNTNLEILDCSSNMLSTISANSLKMLKELYVSGNENIKSLDLSKNTMLEKLYMDMRSNNTCTMKTLDLSKNTALKELSCENIKFTALDVSKNTSLVKLNIYGTDLTNIDLSKCRNLVKLNCGWCRLSELDITNNPKLESLDCYLAFAEIQGNILFLWNNPKLILAYEKGRLSYSSSSNFWYDYDADGDGWHDYSIHINASTIVFTKKPDVLFVECGKSKVLDPSAAIGKGSYTWTSSDSKVATVDSKGKITGKMAGSAIISVICDSKRLIQPVTVLYKDVTNEKDFWFEPTNYLTAAGIVKGYDNQTKFKPTNECSRAQMVTFLWRLNGSPNPKSKTTTFKDIETSDYFYKPVLWAVEKGITTGVTKEKFDPQGVCTRAQTVTFLWRMANKPEPKAKTSKFKDVNAKDYFCKAAIWASEKKILAGYDDNTFRPKGHCLRRQMVTFLYKYDKYINGKG